MPRVRFVLSPEALDDRDQIWLYIAEDDIPAADRVEHELREAIRSDGSAREVQIS